MKNQKYQEGHPEIKNLRGHGSQNLEFFITKYSLYDSVTILLPSAQNDRVNVDGIHETGPALAEAILVNNCLQSFQLDTVTKHHELGSIVLWARLATWNYSTPAREEGSPCLSSEGVVSGQREGLGDGMRLAGFLHSGTNQQNGCLVTGLLVDRCPLAPRSGRRGKFP